MGIFSKEDKASMAFAGLDAGLKLFDDYRETSKMKRLKDLEDNRIDIAEYKRVCDELEEYESMVYNLISDTELNSKFRKTEEIFVSIIKIIMFDLEHDNAEIFENLNNFIDNDEFIDGHTEALRIRSKRIDAEYQEELKEYEIELKEYEIKLKEHNSKGFFKKLLSEETPVAPIKPQRRE